MQGPQLIHVLCVKIQIWDWLNLKSKCFWSLCVYIIVLNSFFRSGVHFLNLQSVSFHPFNKRKLTGYYVPGIRQWNIKMSKMWLVLLQRTLRAGEKFWEMNFFFWIGECCCCYFKSRVRLLTDLATQAPLEKNSSKFPKVTI